ncbi:hypothetical protein K1T71_000199 [Dendrolimus kikuchii]|uniref:Uncharacterized protein n=1 Tax=Dendrolimus kikuchii TaxID=765133 RepID=A0ACC1DIQ0_9NEOP|nr:hypothetical protein K1T71_000199 [Dendrolimus kikuchii]
MVVKRHKLVVHDNHHFIQLLNYIQHINEDPNYLPSSSELIKISQDIINCLAQTHDNEEQMWTLLHSVQEYVLRIVNTVNDSIRDDVVSAILHKFYSVISDPQTEAGPATSVVLVALAGSGEEAMLSAARWWVQQNENGPASAGLKAALSCLYRWMCEWRHTLTLGDWVMSFIKALEETEKYDLLIEISLDHIVQLFLALNDPEVLRENVADVIFRVLESLRESPEAFDRISPHINIVLTNLAADSGQWSRQLLQTLVDILTTMVDETYGSLKDERERENFKNKYSAAKSCLERQMPSRTRQSAALRPWRPRGAAPSNMNVSRKKVGLLNLGNTCFINSVLQALLTTRLFSNHVMLRMSKAPYWSRLGILFAKMLYSVISNLNPNEFISAVNTPLFPLGNQHDSSEFLGFFLMLLQSYEHCSDRNFDYSKPAVINNDAIYPSTSESTASVSHVQSDSASSSHRPPSPRPSSSTGGSGPNLRKRPSLEASPVTRKRARKQSFIDEMFGGELLTHIQCTVCRSLSLSRDVFRELQLAYPDKRDAGRHTIQHLLDYYCAKETMSDDNKYFCNYCGTLCDAEKSVLIETPPKYLILVLKTFKFHTKVQMQTKLMLSTLHNPTVTLPTVRSSGVHSVYKIYALVIHDGTTLDSGHYYTVANDNDQWYVFNDEEVSAIGDSYLRNMGRSCTPYILFYKRTDVDDGVVPSLEELPPLLHNSVKAHNKTFVEAAPPCRTRP